MTIQIRCDACSGGNSNMLYAFDVESHGIVNNGGKSVIPANANDSGYSGLWHICRDCWQSGSRIGITAIETPPLVHEPIPKMTTLSINWPEPVAKPDPEIELGIGDAPLGAPAAAPELTEVSVIANRMDEDAAITTQEPAGEPASEQVATPEPEAPPAKEARPAGPLARRAGILCNEKGFQVFMDCRTADECAEELRAACGVTSRRDLDDDGDAAIKFRDLIARYTVWLRTGD